MELTENISHRFLKWNNVFCDINVYLNINHNSSNPGGIFSNSNTKSSHAINPNCFETSE